MILMRIRQVYAIGHSFRTFVDISSFLWNIKKNFYNYFKKDCSHIKIFKRILISIILLVLLSIVLFVLLFIKEAIRIHADGGQLNEFHIDEICWSDNIISVVCSGASLKN